MSQDDDAIDPEEIARLRREAEEILRLAQAKVIEEMEEQFKEEEE